MFLLLKYINKNINKGNHNSQFSILNFQFSILNFQLSFFNLLVSHFILITYQ